MLDFSKINAFENGQRESFESLVRILANRERPIDGVEFQPNDGSGGDGGVEALWITSDKRKIGYQAKYIESLGKSQLRQMDESIGRAIDTHPELKKYVFAIPFDLTPNRGPRARESQQKKWDDRIEKWKELADKKGIDLEVVLWTKTIIADMLFKNENFELRRHWFEEKELDNEWFCSHISSAANSLNDRFNPDFHVKVKIEKMFDTIVRGPSILKKISSAFKLLEKTQLPSREFKPTEYASGEKDLEEATVIRDALLQLAGGFKRDLPSPWPVNETLKQLSLLGNVIQTLQGQYLSIDRETLEKSDRHDLDRVVRSLKEFPSICNKLRKILSVRYIAAEESRCSLVHGYAGVGKSHLLARVAEERVKIGFPTVLLLGQDYSNLPFWDQTGKLLGLKGRTSKEILGLLNAVGARKRQRILLLFDAINEGAGPHYWYSQIPGLVGELKNYPYVTMIFSCREEYLPFAVPKNLLDGLPKYRVSGFSSAKELEHAAIKYLDKKGIARPNTPWLAPEFSNPLFLKITSEALEKKRATEFPKGLRGISEIIALYLDAMSSFLKTAPVNAVNISNEITRVVQEVAQKMAEMGQDFLNEDDAQDLIARSFSGRTPPAGKTWLQILSEASLFRLDPPPIPDNFDPLNPPPNRVRFTFQRFQDHLMAIALTKKIRKGHETEAFIPEGPLSFLLAEYPFGAELEYRFTGLVGSLSTTFPEELGIEFATTLPEWEQIWKKGRVAQIGFAESIRWRKTDAFSEKTLDLLNSLDGHEVDTIGLLLEVSMAVEHPYNALLLHGNLKKWSLPERDRVWTWWVNQEGLDEYSQIERIISWALALLDRPADVEHLNLASISLAWCLSSSYMKLRDRATKALTTIFLANSDIFEFIVRLTHDCDDPYVIERLYAAAFGACCIDQTSERLSSYSSLIYDLVFADGKPPIGLLVRDYALGVIELAEAKGALSKKVHLPKCYHPFSSDPPTFNLREEEVEKIAEHAGDKQIYMSAAGEWGDYGKYSIPGRVNFLNTSLQEPRPLTEDELKEQFFEKVIKPFPERVSALNDLETLIRTERGLKFQNLLSVNMLETTHNNLENRPIDEKVKQSIEQHDEKRNQSRAALEQYLSADERKRLSSEYLREGKTNQKDDRVSVDQCRLWVTKRAYELGWTAERFPEDHTGAGYVPRQSDLERIGKKYQRIALDELQARLADNYWIVQDDSEIPTIYRHSDHDFRRNIEPTILPNGTRYGDSYETELNWAKQPEVSLPHVDRSDLIEWPFKEDPTASIKNKIFRTDQNGGKWLVLYEFSLDTQKHSDPNPAEHGTRYEEFRFIYCVLTPLGKSTELVRHLNQKKSLDVSSFKPREFANGPYLLEAHWRDTWKSQKFMDRIWGIPKDIRCAIPVADYHWESHLDKTLPEGFSRHLPQMWFVNELRLKMANSNANSWTNSEDRTVLTSASGSEGRSTVVIDERAFMDYASQFNMEPVWVMIAERSAWPSGGNDSFRGRRAEAVAWYDGKTLRKRGWKRDTKK